MTLQEKLEKVPVEKDFFAELSKDEVAYENLMGKIASQLILERKKQKMSQAEFAKKLGVKQSLISKWESGDNNFTFKQVIKIFTALEVDIDITFGERSESSVAYCENQPLYTIKQQTDSPKTDACNYNVMLNTLLSKGIGEIA